jgi:hypothetical protein
MVYNDWGLYGFVQMLEYKCLALGKHSLLLMSAIRRRCAMPASTSRICGRLLAGTERKFGQKVNAEEHPASTNGPSSKVQA